MQTKKVELSQGTNWHYIYCEIGVSFHQENISKF